MVSAGREGKQMKTGWGEARAKGGGRPKGGQRVDISHPSSYRKQRRRPWGSAHLFPQRGKGRVKW
eukprot:scaffold16747_cov86-Isochrysis_galbana.AAC.2